MSRARRRTPARVALAAKRPAAAPAGGAATATGTGALRATYVEAVTLYERGLEALQRRELGAAREAFWTILQRYPEERELHERVRLYLKVCDRQSQPPPPPPRSVEDRIYAGTVALNAGATAEALSHLQSAVEQAPDNDYAHYMLAVAHAQRGEVEAALTHLRSAIEINPENRVLARQESDFESVRRQEAFRRLVEPPPQPSPRRRGRARAVRQG